MRVSEPGKRSQMHAGRSRKMQMTSTTKTPNAGLGRRRRSKHSKNSPWPRGIFTARNTDGSPNALRSAPSVLPAEIGSSSRHCRAWRFSRHQACGFWMLVCWTASSQRCSRAPSAISSACCASPATTRQEQGWPARCVGGARAAFVRHKSRSRRGAQNRSRARAIAGLWHVDCCAVRARQGGCPNPARIRSRTPEERAERVRATRRDGACPEHGACARRDHVSDEDLG